MSQPTEISIPGGRSPWAALSALCIGFFMIMLDTTIVNVAIPSMIDGLDASLDEIIWVNSVYLLTYAVPLLLAGRLGDRFGPKRLFLAGLAVFTAASLWCGLADSATMLIVARAVQGLGAAAMTPQTMAFITRLFPPSKRGAPMGMWGAVAGVATIAGPLLGGVLVESFGWEWIFFVNVPIGIAGLVLTVILVPDWQPKHSHRFDVPGIVLSSLGLFGVVFGLQEGQAYDWGTVVGPITIFEIIAAGLILLVAFVVWQKYNRNEPLLPLRLFHSRNFSTGNVANMAIGFAITGMFLPLIIYIQSVLGFSPLQSGLLTAPMSLLSGIIAPFAGRLSDKMSGKYVVMTGFAALAAGVGIVSLQIEPDSNAWSLVPALLICGFGIGCIFSPLANLSTTGLAPQLIGAGSGIFNTSRQVGGVLGSAAIGVLLQSRVAAELPAAAQDAAAALPEQFRQQFVDSFTGVAGSAGEFGTAGSNVDLPAGIPGGVADQLRTLGADVFATGFTAAVKTTLILPVSVLVVGVLSAVLMASSARAAAGPDAPQREPQPTTA